MTCSSVSRTLVSLVCLAVFSLALQAQPSNPGIVAAPSTQGLPSNVISFSDTLPGQPDGAIPVTFSLYPDQQSTAATWVEDQVVQVVSGKYTVLLGSATTNGIPPDVFSGDQAHWLGVQINGTEKRYLLVSVPYAMKALEADRLGGLAASQYVTQAQLQSLMQTAAASGSSTTTSGIKTTPGPVGNASLNPPQPATDFTDNNTSEVLLVTQQGTGFAIHAISAGDAAVFGENSTPTGTGLKGLASSTTGINFGVIGSSASPTGIAGVFDNTGGGQILSLRANGNEVAAVDNFGNFTANRFSGFFSGDGSQLFNISPFAVGAQSNNVANAIVMRDTFGNFAANRISGFFSGDGSQLFNISPFAVGAQSNNVANAIVMRDAFGNFAANRISGFFAGDGSQLFNIPPFAVGAQSDDVANAIVMRDAFGNFAANRISGFFAGDGSQLFNIQPFAVGAQSINVPNAIVARDGNGNFSAGLISAGSISSSGPITGVNISATATQGVPAIHGSADGGFGIQASTVYGYGLWAEATSPNTVGTALVLSHASKGKLISGGVGAFPLLNSETFSVDGSGNITFNGGLMTPYETTGTWVAGSLVKLTSNQGTLFEGTVTMTSPGDTSGVVGIITGLTSGSSMIQVARSGQAFCNFDGNGTPTIGDYVGISKTTAGYCADIGPNYPNDGQQVIGRVLSTELQRVLLFDSESHSSAGGGVTINTGAGLTGGPITGSGTISIPNNGITNAMLGANSVTSANIADGSLTPAKIAGTAATLGTNTFTGTQNIPVINTGSITASGNINTSNLFSFNGGTFTGPLVVNTSVGSALALVGGDSNNPGIAAVNALGGPAVQGTSTASNGIGIVGRTSGNQSVAGLFVNTQGNGRIISAGVGSGTFGSEVFSVDTAGNVFNGGALVASFPGSTATTTPSGLAKLDVNGFAVSTAPGDTSGAVGVVLPLGGTTSSVRIAYGGTAFCVFDSVPHIRDFVQISATTTGECADVGPNYPTSGQVIGRVTGVASGTGGFVLLSGPSTQAIKAGIGTINTGAGLTGGPITSSGTISIGNNAVTNAMLQNNSVTVSAGSGLSGGGTVPLGGSMTLTNTGTLSFNGRSGNVLAAPGDYSFSQLAGTLVPNQLPSTTVFNNQNNTFTTDQTINGALTTNTLTTGALTATSLNVPLLSASGNSTSAQSVISAFDTAPTGGFGAFSASSQNNAAGFFISSGPTILAVGTPTHGVLVVGSQGVNVTGTASATAFSGDGSGLTNVSATSIGSISAANVATTTSLNSETAARQSGDAALATSISAETASRQADTTNLQTSINNLSTADAKLASSNTFTASNTFSAGTQDFSAAGATLPVRSLPTAQAPTTCVANKELLIKTDAAAGQQLFICDVSGASWNLVGDGAAGGVASFNGRNGNVSPASGDYSFGQISGSAAQTQLPANVVYNNQVNTFNASQAVNGNMSATSFTGNGSGLTNVNAVALNGFPSTSFAQLATNNTFTGTVTAASFNGSGSGLTSVNAATVNNLQMLKLSASITPASVTNQTCVEQTFTISGVNTGDVLLSVQPSGHSPGTNIAIGGWRVPSANTVAIQFCNVSRNNSTPTAGTYTIALMR